jgi:hypothetical protein
MPEEYLAASLPIEVLRILFRMPLPDLSAGGLCGGLQWSYEKAVGDVISEERSTVFMYSSILYCFSYCRQRSDK